MSLIGQSRLKQVVGLMLAIGASSALLVLVAPVAASPPGTYNATFVEPYGGPVHSPFACDPGTSCGTANLGNLGHGSTVVQFNGCGLGCQVRTINFDDGSQLVIHEFGNLADFESPGNSGHHGYIGLGLPGDPQFLAITQTIVGGTGRFAGASGSGSGTVKVAGGVAIIEATGAISIP